MEKPRIQQMNKVATEALGMFLLVNEKKIAEKKKDYGNLRIVFRCLFNREPVE